MENLTNSSQWGVGRVKGLMESVGYGNVTTWKFGGQMMTMLSSYSQGVAVVEGVCDLAL